MNTPKKLNALGHVFATQYFAQWIDKHHLREQLKEFKNAKMLRQYFDANATKFNWTAEEKRRWKRAAVLILQQL